MVDRKITSLNTSIFSDFQKTVKMNTPLVSIAIPIYNAGKYLDYAICSCINQTYTNWELLLVCDGSTDNSLQIAESYAAKDGRITIVNDGINKGLVYRLNQSVQMAKGKYYARMDADDIMGVHRIEEQVNFLENHLDIDLVGSSIMIIDNKNEIVGSGSSVGEVDGFIHPTVMGHTEWFRRNPYSDWAVRAEDKELWCRTFRNSRFWSLEKPLLFYREFGVPTLNKTLMTQKTLLKIFSRYSNYDKSLGWALKNIVFTLAKMCAYMFFAMIGKIDFIVSRRSRKPVPSELCMTQDDLLLAICK